LDLVTSSRGIRKMPEKNNPTEARGRIDKGRIGDKVAAPDPAASPLGTDEEAGAAHDEDGLRIAREATRKAPGTKP
jgi:hypothetical protein